MQQNQRKHSAVMAQIHRERRDNKRASAWLAKHSLKAKPKPKPKPQPLERWQTRVREQKQDRRALAKPLLKGGEEYLDQQRSQWRGGGGRYREQKRSRKGTNENFVKLPRPPENH